MTNIDTYFPLKKWDHIYKFNFDCIKIEIAYINCPFMI